MRGVLRTVRVEVWVSRRNHLRKQRLFYNIGDARIQCRRPGECFPADARVALEGGGAKAMAELATGDRVLAADGAGRLFFDDAAFFGLRNAAAPAAFVVVETESSAALRPTPDHFLPALADAACADAGAGANLWAARALLPAQEIPTAHRVWVAGADGQAPRPEKGARVALAEHAGLFNPPRALRLDRRRRRRRLGALLLLCRRHLCGAGRLDPRRVPGAPPRRRAGGGRAAPAHRGCGGHRGDPRAGRRAGGPPQPALEPRGGARWGRRGARSSLSYTSLK
jgi:hypothetical protein